ncbi:MAG: M20 family metallopeptidase [Thermovirga sp.]
MDGLANIREEIASLNEELVALRRDFHMYPELGFQEKRTSEKVASYLDDLGLKVRKKVARTGVIGVLEGSGEGPCVMLRADMDALPLEEKNDSPYRSRNDGVMHACGHDAHVAMLLAAAKVLARRREKIPGSIVFLFQPNEEAAGALKMIEEGALENPRPDAAFAIHVWTPIESGKIAASPGPVMAALDTFDITIKGRGGHTGAPHMAIDPVLAAADLITSVQMIQTREIDVLRPTLIMFGKINAGTAKNIVPDIINLGGTIRYLYEGGSESPEKPIVRFERVVRNVCQAHQCEWDLEFVPENTTVINDECVTGIVRKAAREVVGSGNLTDYIGTAGEDFSEFARILPSCFYFLGAGNMGKGISYPHHHPRFDIDEDVLPLGVEMHVRTAIGFLEDRRTTGRGSLGAVG